MGNQRPAAVIAEEEQDPTDSPYRYKFPKDYLEHIKRVPEPIIDAKRDEIKSAMKMQKKNQEQYIKDKQDDLDKVLQAEKDLIYGIPRQIIGSRLKKEFIRARTQVMNRTLHTEAQTKMQSEWTLPKMVIQAKIEEKHA